MIFSERGLASRRCAWLSGVRQRKVTIESGNAERCLVLHRTDRKGNARNIF